MKTTLATIVLISTVCFLTNSIYGQLAGLNEKEPFSPHEIFYWTTREQETTKHGPVNYSWRLATATAGKCIVTVPHERKPGTYNRPTFISQESPSKHLTLSSVTPLSKECFFSQIRDSISRTHDPGLLIMVHGYDYLFSEACYRAGQFVKDTNFKGTVVLFSWPSLGETGKRGYFRDTEQAMMADTDFAAFLLKITAQVPDASVKILAHSLGCRIVCSAFAHINANRDQQRIEKVDELVLSAADIDGEAFRVVYLPSLYRLDCRVTIYVSQKDLALQQSTILNGGSRRIGDISNAPLSLPGVDLLDVTACHCQSGPLGLGHLYHVDSIQVMKDIARVLNGISCEKSELPGIK